MEIHTPFKNTVTLLSCRVEIHGLGLLGLRILKDMAVIVTQQVALQTVTHGPQRPRPTEVTVEIAVATHGRAIKKQCLKATLFKFAPIIALCLLCFGSESLYASCVNAASEGYDGYRDARKAYRAGDLSRCKRYARKAYKHFSYAESEASSCRCSNVGLEAYDAYRDAKKAYRSGDLDNCKRYSKQAYRHGSSLESYASSCF